MSCFSSVDICRGLGHVLHCVLVYFLKPVPLSENGGTLNQQLEACRSMPQHAAASQNFLGDRWCLLAACLLAATAAKPGRSTLDTKKGYKTKAGSTSSVTLTLALILVLSLAIALTLIKTEYWDRAAW